MGTLRTELDRIASSFVSSVLDAMRSASLSDLADQAGGGRASAPSTSTGKTRGRPPRGGRSAAAAPAPAPARKGAPAASGGKAGRRRRASPDEVAKQKDAALAAAKGLKAPFSKGDVMNKSGSKVDLGRALSLLVNEGKLIKKGDRRMTRYWVK